MIQGGVSGYIGEGAIFNGSSSKITATSPTQGNTDASYSFWIKTDTVNDSKTVFGQDSDSSRNPFTIQWYDSTAAGKMTFTMWRCFNDQIWYQTNYLSDFDYDYQANTWYHIVLTYTASTKTVRNYVNGGEVGNGATLSLLASGVTTGTQMVFGSYNNLAGSFFDGSIDQVRIYDKVLSSSEVSTLYGETASSNITISDLVAYYPMEGTSLDQEGSYHGTDSNVEYNYNGTATNVTYQDATNFSPDLVWVKDRDAGYAHQLYDTVRGATEKLHSNTTAAESTDSTGLTAFDSNGFTISTNVGINTNNNDYVAWCFNAGTDAAASNTDGSITSTVKANQDAGFSISKFNIPSSGSSVTVGHGLEFSPTTSYSKKLLTKQGVGLFIPKQQGASKEAYLELSNALGVQI